MGISAEFAVYGAKLVNLQWAVSALTESELVVSLGSHRIKTLPDVAWVHHDHLGRWSCNGSSLFADHLRIAIAEERPVRLVLVRTDDMALVESGEGASKSRKSFKARPERIGRVTRFDGNTFTIVFAKSLA